jgi:hypothetical protein
VTRERIRETIRESRREQGMPETVSDARFLEELAADVIDREAPTVEFPVVRLVGGEDHGKVA